jgi:L-2-hydroxyglutarate oxidase
VSSKRYDIAVVGAGIVGLSVARALSRQRRVRVAVLEAEPRPATHQTGHNSGVIHSGLYYRPGSLKARNCLAGRDALYRFCEQNGVSHENCGKLVVATREDELERLDGLERRGRDNGLTGLRRLRGEELREREPHVAGIAGLWVPQTGIVDFTEVARVLVRHLREHDGELRTSFRVETVRRCSDGFVLRSDGDEVEARHLINCAGLHSDRIARRCGLRPGVRIVPFRGDYYQLKPSREHLVRNLIYPVPDPRFPFLGVHLTRMIRGGVEAGPNAVLALKREGYSRVSFSAPDLFEMLSYGGFWRMAARFWRTGLGELRRSLSRRAFATALRRLVPELLDSDVTRCGSGVRAQAVTPDGRLLDDFRILANERMLHVLNAPSPAATAALSIGDSVATQALESFDLG